MSVELMEVSWDDIQIGDIILNDLDQGKQYIGADNIQQVVDNDPSLPVIMDILPDRPCVCYEIITDKGSIVASSDHLIAVNGGPFDQYGLTYLSKRDGNHPENEAIACEDIWYHLAEMDENAIIHGVNGDFTIRPYDEILPGRCVTVSTGKFSINGALSFNTARGSHGLDSMKDIVYNLINIAGMSPEWVSQNLFLDLESIKRMQQLSGLKAAMNDIDDCDMAWSPEADSSYQRKVDNYLTREAIKYVDIYRHDHPEEDIDDTGTAQDVAERLGWDRQKAIETREFNIKNAIGSNNFRTPNIGHPA